jgi:hypothetical protein
VFQSDADSRAGRLTLISIAAVEIVMSGHAAPLGTIDPLPGQSPAASLI